MRAILLCLFLLPLPARACDLALVLAVDVSGSVDPRDFHIQMQGLADALRDPVVSEALVRAQAAVLLLQWTGASRQEVTLPWRRIADFDAIERLARDIETAPRRWRNFSTAIGEALAFALRQFDGGPTCARQVIDISGDGTSNEGPPPRSVHPALAAAGVTVNALAVEATEPDLTAYFYENVITGPGAFVATAADYPEYPDRIRMKLRRETIARLAAQ